MINRDIANTQLLNRAHGEPDKTFDVLVDEQFVKERESRVAEHNVPDCPWYSGEPHFSMTDLHDIPVTTANDHSKFSVYKLWRVAPGGKVISQE